MTSASSSLASPRDRDGCGTEQLEQGMKELELAGCSAGRATLGGEDEEVWQEPKRQQEQRPAPSQARKPAGVPAGRLTEPRRGDFSHATQPGVFALVGEAVQSGRGASRTATTTTSIDGRGSSSDSEADYPAPRGVFATDYSLPARPESVKEGLSPLRPPTTAS